MDNASFGAAKNRDELSRRIKVLNVIAPISIEDEELPIR